jgi:CRP-like cAMP-binding protein
MAVQGAKMTYKVELKALAMLRSAELTRDMETRHLRKLASMASEVEFSAGELIYQKGDMGRAVYLIEEGEVVVELAMPGQGRMTINTFGAQDGLDPSCKTDPRFCY